MCPRLLIDFWGGAQCRGTPEGEYHHTFNGNSPCHQIPTNAESATVASKKIITITIIIISVRRGVGIPTALEARASQGAWGRDELRIFIHEYLNTQVIPKKAFQA
jgi:hypothetical protein